jgi:RNA polymerase sigma factor (sigma-70 family)
MKRCASNAAQFENGWDVERDLVIRARNGDRVAFGELATLYGDRWYALAYRILRDGDRAQDVVQDTIIAVWRDLRALRDLDRFDTWAWKVLVRLCYREARRARRDRPMPFLLPNRSAEDPISRLADRDELERIFTRLSPDQRAVVALQYYLGMTHPQIAAALDIPVGTVGSRLHAAKRALRAALAANSRLDQAVENRP